MHLLLQTAASGISDLQGKLIVGLVSTVIAGPLGAWCKYWFDQRSQKRLQILEERQKFSLPPVFGKGGTPGENLHVGWRDTTYASLTRATYRLRNIGLTDIPE